MTNRIYHKQQIISISGKIGSGKDTLAELIATNTSLPIERHAFADTLRSMVHALTGYPLQVMYDNQMQSPFENVVKNYTQADKEVFLPEFGKTIGQILQELGTDALRTHFDSEIWVKALKNKINATHHSVIIPDLRFKNEARAIREMGGILIRIEGDPAAIRKNSTRMLEHASEVDLDDWVDWDFVIENTDTIEALKLVVKGIVKKIF